MAHYPELKRGAAWLTGEGMNRLVQALTETERACQALKQVAQSNLDPKVEGSKEAKP